MLIGVDPFHAFIFSGGRAYTDNYVDQTEVDTLTGGAGADRFVLGTSSGFYYGYTVDWKPAGTTDQNRAIITDFNQSEGDVLQLYGNASMYTTASNGHGGLNIFLKEPAGGQQLIAELQGVTSFNLSGPGAVYGGTADFTPSAFMLGQDDGVSNGALARGLALQSAPVPQTFDEFAAQHSTPEDIDPAALKRAAAAATASRNWRTTAALPPLTLPYRGSRRTMIPIP